MCVAQYYYYYYYYCTRPSEGHIAARVKGQTPAGWGLGQTSERYMVLQLIKSELLPSFRSDCQFAGFYLENERVREIMFYITV